MRRALAPLAAMAQRTGIAVVVVRHLNKAEGGNALYRGGGSIGIVGAARSALRFLLRRASPSEAVAQAKASSSPRNLASTTVFATTDPP